MPATHKLILREDQRKQLEAWIKNPPRPYLRRKAWALKLRAEGQPDWKVALDRRVHAHRTTVAEWVRQYEAEGLEGLKQKPGQGRKPAFSPSLEA